MANIMKFTSEIFDVNSDITKNMENLKKNCEKNKIWVKEDPENNDLFMLSFEDNADFSDKIVREANGAIFSKKDFSLVHYSFEKCYDGISGLGISTHEDIQDPFVIDSESGFDFSVELYFEGSIVKAFDIDGVWHWATSRCFDASKVTWKTKRNFLELFKECIVYTHGIDINTFSSTALKPGNMYTFIMQHPEIHSDEGKTSVPMMWSINEIDKKSFCFTDLNEDMKVVNKSNDLNSLFSFLEKRDKKSNYVVNIYKKDSGEIVKRVKILNNTLKRKNELNGKFQDICIGYLRYADSDNIEMHEYYDLFSENQEDFRKMDSLYRSVVHQVHRMYIDKHVLKKDQELYSGEEFKKYERTVYQLHCQYRRTKKPIKVEDVDSKLKSMNVYSLAKVIGYSQKN